MERALLRFIVEAKRNSYAKSGAEADAEADAEVLSRRIRRIGEGKGALLTRNPDGSKELTFSRGAYSYRDFYYGGRGFSGIETVWKNGAPAWAMVYTGKSFCKRKEEGLVFSFLKECLSRVGLSAPYRGPGRLSEGKLSYSNRHSGEPGSFSGREEIRLQGKVVFRLSYSGGIIF